VLDFRVFLGFFWGLGFFFGFGFLWVIVGFPMYTLCVPKGTLPFFDIYIRIFFFISNVLYIKNPKGCANKYTGTHPTRKGAQHSIQESNKRPQEKLPQRNTQSSQGAPKIISLTKPHLQTPTTAQALQGNNLALRPRPLNS
jgi:hypothetical protein